MLALSLTILSVLRIIASDSVISAERDYNNVRKKEDRSYRRFLENLNDDEWHVAHLKETDFASRSECPSDTLEEKVNKYKEALKHDAGFVEYVSSQAIPFNVTELTERQKCQAPSPKAHFFKAIMPANVTKEQKQEVLTATTVKEKKTLSEEEKNLNDGKKSRRDVGPSGEQYVFTSDEYYDDATTDWDDDLCPGDITVIVLEQDQLRSYEVECELILEWRSLE